MSTFPSVQPFCSLRMLSTGAADPTAPLLLTVRNWVARRGSGRTGGGKRASAPAGRVWDHGRLRRWARGTPNSEERRVSAATRRAAEGCRSVTSEGWQAHVGVDAVAPAVKRRDADEVVTPELEKPCSERRWVISYLCVCV